MFGIGYQDMFLIVVAAMVIFGPKRLPEVAGQLGRWIREFRKMTADLTGEFEKTFAEVDEIKESFRKELTGVMDEVDAVGKSVAKDLNAPTTGKKAAAKSNGTSGNGKGKHGLADTVPLATKTDPLSDVSLLDDTWVKPVRKPMVSANGSSHSEADAVAAMDRVRQRRAKAGYGRRA